jgi:hypothetical protein
MLVLMLQRVSSRVSGFPVASPCLWGKLQNLSCFKVSKQVVTRFCLVGVPLRDILTCLSKVSKVVLCGRRDTFASFSQEELQFSWQAQPFRDLHRDFAWQAQHFRRVVLRVFCQSRCQGCVKWRHGANSVAGVAVCEM